MLKKISIATPGIQKSLYKLPPTCNESCYAGLTDTCPYILPLAEFGFYKYYQDDARESKAENSKATIPFVLALIAFFFPILKSILTIKSVFRTWWFNREIDGILAKKEKIPDFSELRQEIADKYAEGQLTETHYKALDNRLSAHSGDNSISKKDLDSIPMVVRMHKKDQLDKQENKKGSRKKTLGEFGKYANPDNHLPEHEKY